MFFVKSSKNYSDDVTDFEVDFGNEASFFCCSCPSFKRDRMICMHFFAVFANRKASYTYLLPLLKNHPYATLDADLIKTTKAVFWVKEIKISTPALTYL